MRLATKTGSSPTKAGSLSSWPDIESKVIHERSWSSPKNFTASSTEILRRLRTVAIAGKACGGLNDDARTAMRRHNIGFVYQHHHLLPEFSALENVAIPQIITGLDWNEARRRSSELLSWMGLETRERHRPARLSGGEQQRVALARAAAPRPAILLADEPTGNLDTKTGVEIMAIFEHLFERGNTILIVTHEAEVAAHAHRVIHIRDGGIEKDERQTRAKRPTVITSD